MFEKICETCKKSFLVKERRHFDGNRSRKFCSLRCSSISCYSKNKQKILKTCFKKGHPFYPKKENQPIQNKPKKVLTGELNPAYKHGKRVGHLAKLYKKLAFSNFDNWCLVCRDNNRLHVHHIDGNHLNHSLNNLCILCNSCYQRFHRCQIKLPNPHYIASVIEAKISSLDLDNDFLKIQRRRYFLRKELTNPNYNFSLVHLESQ